MARCVEFSPVSGIGLPPPSQHGHANHTRAVVPEVLASHSKQVNRHMLQRVAKQDDIELAFDLGESFTLDPDSVAVLNIHSDKEIHAARIVTKLAQIAQ